MKNTDSGTIGEKQIDRVISDYLDSSDRGGLTDDFMKLDLNEKTGDFYPPLPKPNKGIYNGAIEKDGHYHIFSSSGHSLLIINENKNKGSPNDSGSIIDTYIHELTFKLPRTIKHYEEQGIASLVVGLFTVTGLPRIKNWNWNDTELSQHLYEQKIWFPRQPYIRDIYTELDDILDYYAHEIDWENTQPDMKQSLKDHMGISGNWQGITLPNSQAIE